MVKLRRAWRRRPAELAGAGAEAGREEEDAKGDSRPGSPSQAKDAKRKASRWRRRKGGETSEPVSSSSSSERKSPPLWEGGLESPPRSPTPPRAMLGTLELNTAQGEARVAHDLAATAITSHMDDALVADRGRREVDETVDQQHHQQQQQRAQAVLEKRVPDLLAWVDELCKLAAASTDAESGKVLEPVAQEWLRLCKEDETLRGRAKLVEEVDVTPYTHAVKTLGEALLDRVKEQCSLFLELAESATSLVPGEDEDSDEERSEPLGAIVQVVELVDRHHLEKRLELERAGFAEAVVAEMLPRNRWRQEALQVMELAFRAKVDRTLPNLQEQGESSTRTAATLLAPFQDVNKDFELALRLIALPRAWDVVAVLVKAAGPRVAEVVDPDMVNNSLAQDNVLLAVQVDTMLAFAETCASPPEGVVETLQRLSESLMAPFVAQAVVRLEAKMERIVESNQTAIQEPNGVLRTNIPEDVFFVLDAELETVTVALGLSGHPLVSFAERALLEVMSRFLDRELEALGQTPRSIERLCACLNDVDDMFDRFAHLEEGISSRAKPSVIAEEVVLPITNKFKLYFEKGAQAIAGQVFADLDAQGVFERDLFSTEWQGGSSRTARAIVATLQDYFEDVENGLRRWLRSHADSDILFGATVACCLETLVRRYVRAFFVRLTSRLKSSRPKVATMLSSDEKVFAAFFAAYVDEMAVAKVSSVDEVRGKLNVILCMQELLVASQPATYLEAATTEFGEDAVVAVERLLYLRGDLSRSVMAELRDSAISRTSAEPNNDGGASTAAASRFQLQDLHELSKEATKITRQRQRRKNLAGDTDKTTTKGGKKGKRKRRWALQSCCGGNGLRETAQHENRMERFEAK